MGEGGGRGEGGSRGRRRGKREEGREEVGGIRIPFLPSLPFHLFTRFVEIEIEARKNKAKRSGKEGKSSMIKKM